MSVTIGTPPKFQQKNNADQLIGERQMWVRKIEAEIHGTLQRTFDELGRICKDDLPADFTKEIAQLRNQVSSLEASRNALKDIITCGKAENERQMDELRELRKTHTDKMDLQDIVVDLKIRLKQSEQVVKNWVETARVQQESIEQLRSKFGHAEEEADNRRRAQTEVIGELQGEIETLRFKLGVHERADALNAAELKGRRADCQSAANTIDVLTKTLQEKTAEVNRWHDDFFLAHASNVDLTKALGAAREEVEGCRKDIASLQQNLSYAHSAHSDLKDTAEVFQKHIGALEADNSALSKEREALKHECRRFLEDNVKLQEQLDAVSIEKRSLKHALDLAEKARNPFAKLKDVLAERDATNLRAENEMLRNLNKTRENEAAHWRRMFEESQKGPKQIDERSPLVLASAHFCASLGMTPVGPRSIQQQVAFVAVQGQPLPTMNTSSNQACDGGTNPNYVETPQPKLDHTYLRDTPIRRG